MSRISFPSSLRSNRHQLIDIDFAHGIALGKDPDHIGAVEPNSQEKCSA